MPLVLKLRRPSLSFDIVLRSPLGLLTAFAVSGFAPHLHAQDSGTPSTASFPLEAEREQTVVSTPETSAALPPAPTTQGTPPAPVPATSESTPLTEAPAVVPPEARERPAAAPSNAGTWNQPMLSNNPPPTDVPHERTLPAHAEKRDSIHDDWMLALSAVTHAPVDLGVEVCVEMPFGLRLAASYGYVPSAYLGVITGILTSANAVDDSARALVENGFENGKSWRLQIGMRPFRSFGGFIDAGYSRVTLSGSLDATEVQSIAGFNPSSNYSVDSTLNLWFVELGYQAVIAERLVLAFGIGVMRTTGAHTTALANGSSSQTTEAVSAKVDDAIEKYGVIPTLNLRIGFDAI
jgi:hypothetical protein